MMNKKYRIVKLDEYCYIIQSKKYFFFWADMVFYANHGKGEWFTPYCYFVESAMMKIKRESFPEKLGKVKVVNKKNYHRENMNLLKMY